MGKQKSLFKTKIVPGKPGSGNMFDEEFTDNNGPVTCLGIKFESDEARRNHFTELLRQKLKDPDFRKIEGFPIGEDEDILILSNPPYYTACPNPWTGDFIAEWEALKPAQEDAYEYHREPFAADVSEGKNDPIYNAHSYHTKVPHKAIMRYILHYTEPGDIVFDGFCGTGMTGVAAQMCGDKQAIETLGVTKQSPEQKYKVESDGAILERQLDDEGKYIWVKFSKIGARKVVLNDLSPAATFISHNYNTPVNKLNFNKEAKSILQNVEKECGWMYETKHFDGRLGKINFTVWSDVFICPECSEEVIFWNVAVDKEGGCVKNEFDCPNCRATLTKRHMERAWTNKFDRTTNQTVKQAKQFPVLINYTVGKKRFEKKPDELDFEIIEKIASQKIPYWFPNKRMMKGKETRRNDKIGVTHVNHFYTERNLYAMSALRNKIFGKQSSVTQLGMWFTSSHVWGTRLNRLLASNYFKKRGGVIRQTLQGTLYISSIAVETNLLERFNLRIKSVPFTANDNLGVIETCSATVNSLPDSCVDYLFIDPPFGSNIYYSELNSLWENWLAVQTNNDKEAIENTSQGKNLDIYRQLMTKCFSEAFRVLKPGRWVTIEFSNTKAAVWNNIQTALTDAGFVVANVSALEKSYKGYRAVTTPTAVKQDLVISAYKPNGGFEERFELEAQSEEGVWDFVGTHLKYLPVVKKQGFDIVTIPERDHRSLYDQVVAYYVRKGYNVTIDSQEFQLGLAQRFSERDGMYFLPEQVAEYDRKKMIGGGRPLQQSLFVCDEVSAIEWLRNLLRDKPQSFQDINPLFMKEISGWSKNEVNLELSTLLEQNFLLYDGKDDVPEQIHSYLSSDWKDMRNLPKNDPALIVKAKDRWYVPDPNKAGDLEKLREKALLKEFGIYKEAKKKLKVFRLEAVRVGFKKAWQEKDYVNIIAVAEKIPNKILEEDPKLLMWYGQAVTRTGANND